MCLASPQLGPECSVTLHVWAWTLLLLWWCRPLVPPRLPSTAVTPVPDPFELACMDVLVLSMGPVPVVACPLRPTGLQAGPLLVPPLLGPLPEMSWLVVILPVLLWVVLTASCRDTRSSYGCESGIGNDSEGSSAVSGGLSEYACG